MKTFADIFYYIKPLVSKYIMPLLISQTLWTAVAAIVAIVTLYFIYKQVTNARNVAAYEFLRKEDERFSSGEMRHDRSNLAKTLLLKPDNYKAIDKYADYVLGYFEDLGLILKEGLAPEYFVWTMNSYYVLCYWELSKKYINWVREDKEDQTYYSDFEYLYKKMLKREKKERKKKKIEFTPNKLREFLEDELQVLLRLACPH